VEAVTPHRFRHTFATRLLEGNAAGEKADYTQVTAQRLRSAVNVLSKKPSGEKVLFPDSVPAPRVPNDAAATTRNE